MEEKVYTQFSYNYHHQDSFYGTESFYAKQQVAFGQIYWNPTWGDHDLLVGTGLRYTYYDDDTLNAFL